VSIPFVDAVLHPNGETAPRSTNPVSGEALQSSSRAGNGYATLQVFRSAAKVANSAAPTYKVELQASTGGGADAEWSTIGTIEQDDEPQLVVFPTSRGVWYRAYMAALSGSVNGSGIRCVISG